MQKLTFLTLINYIKMSDCLNERQLVSNNNIHLLLTIIQYSISNYHRSWKIYHDVKDTSVAD